MAAGSCVGGDSGVRREVEHGGAQLIDRLAWSVGVKEPGFICGPAFTCAVKSGVTITGKQNKQSYAYFLDISQLEANVCA